MIEQVISHYKILEKLGEGGMGVVYKAEDLKLHRSVAIKFLPKHLTIHDAERKRFFHEAQATSALNHPNICVIHEIDEIGEDVFLVMEYVEGMTLREWTRRRLGHADGSRQYSPEENVNLAIQIAEGLEKAHEKGIIHRDVKSENIMVTEDGRAKIMDFGLAKLRGVSKITKTGSTVGTVAYMSPEQVEGIETDHRTDIFSFGVVLYEMLAGQLPFRADHEAALMYEIVHLEPPSLLSMQKTFDPELNRIVMKCMEKERDVRYQSMKDVAVDLKRFKRDSEGKRIDRTSVKLPKPGPVRPLKSMMRFSLTILLFIAIIAGVILVFRSHTPELNPDMTFRVLQIPFSQIGYPGFTLDGNWLAFQAAKPNGRYDVYWMHATGNQPRRLTMDSSDVWGGVDVSPDGSQVTYSRTNSKSGGAEVCVVSVNGGMSQKIADIGTSSRWRPDGQRIGYIRGRPFVFPSESGKLEFLTVKPDGSDNRLEFIDSAGLATGRVSFSWSMDGKSIAWIRTFPGQYQEVVIRELKSGSERQLTFDRKNIDEVCWTPNDQIIFSSSKSGDINIWMVPVSGGQPVQITKGSGPDIGMKISGDASKLVYLQQQSIGQIWIANSNGSNAHQVTFDDRDRFWPSISPDGMEIAFSMSDAISYVQPVRHIYIMQIDGNNRRKVTSGTGIAGWPQWSPDGKSLVYRVRESAVTPYDSSIVYLIDVSNPALAMPVGKESEIVRNVWFSPDGQWIVYDCWLNSETADSSRVYLTNVSNLQGPKFISKGRAGRWVNPNEFVVYSQAKQFLASIGGIEAGQFYVDSTLERFRSMVRKRKKPREYILSPTHDFFLYKKDDGEVWKISLQDGREEHLRGISLPNLGGGYFSISPDGEQIAWIDARYSAKLVMIDDLFR